MRFEEIKSGALNRKYNYDFTVAWWVLRYTWPVPGDIKEF
jgi:hypothetical protein